MIKTMLILSLVILLSITAQAFTWQEYVGNTQWNLKVIDDESGCGGDLVEKSLAISIKHDGQIADVSNMGHGSVRGTFESNVLHLTARTIPDGAGKSKLSSFKVDFLPDCKTFSGLLTWSYSDNVPQNACSGTTRLEGKRIDAQTCPAVAPKRASIMNIRLDPNDANKEAQYKSVLKGDPDNFWANWDLAQLKKKQGKYDEYFKYFDTATSNEKVYAETKEKLKADAVQKLRLSTYPTTKTSPILRVEQGELDNWEGGFVANYELPKEKSKEKTWHWKIWNLLVPDSNEIVNNLIGLPEEE